MANRFSGVQGAADEKVEEDFIGGGGLLDTDIYTATVKAVYETESTKSKAVALNFILDIDGKEVRQQIWMTNGKGGITYKAKDGSEKNLPGYNQVNSLFMLALGKEIGDTDVEEMTLKLYDYDAKAEVPKQVDCYTDLHGVEIQVAIQRQTVDKTKKDDNTGKYEPTGETRDENEIIKFFPAAAQVTISEVAMHIKSLGGTLDEVLEDDQMEQAIASMIPDGEDTFVGGYAEKWLEKNRGNVYNKAKGAGKSGGKSFGDKKASGGDDAPKKKLF